MCHKSAKMSGGLRAFVAVKRVVDYAVKVRINANKTGMLCDVM